MPIALRPRLSIQTTRLTKDPQQLERDFAALATAQDVANLLEVPPRTLNFLLFNRRKSNYARFDISKRSGGLRVILAPVDSLKILQTKLNQVLQAVYKSKSAVHGFVIGKSILSNAAAHSGSRYVLNLDLADFFPSINFGRVRGMFMAVPYTCNKNVATLLAQICCHENQLPQGAPTSPVVSNMICGKMDSQLTKLAAKFKSRYTRYADDITISTSTKLFPRPLAYFDDELHGRQIKLGAELEKVITDNGFGQRAEKLRLQQKDQRQKVTGLIVNCRPNVPRKVINQARAMLHSWRFDGLDEAERIFRACHDQRHRLNAAPSFKRVVKGKIEYIGFVKGKDSTPYARLLWEYANLDREFKCKTIVVGENAGLPIIEEAIWVIESEDGNGSQGTGFFVPGVGLVTCRHVVKANTYAFDPRHPRDRLPAKIVAADDRLDIAVLRVDARPRVELRLAAPATIQRESEVRLFGFPDYQIGQRVTMELGAVTNESRIFERVHRFQISPQIVGGCSGGPVLNNRNAVLGIASHGSNNQLSQVIRIDHLEELLYG